MSEEKGHNGWKNCATWGVKLILDNDEGSNEYWMEQAVRHLRTAEPIIPGCTKEDKARWNLDEQLRDEITDEVYTAIEDCGYMVSQLMGAALCEVDWQEIADSFIDDAK